MIESLLSPFFPHHFSFHTLFSHKHNNPHSILLARSPSLLSCLTPPCFTPFPHTPTHPHIPPLCIKPILSRCLSDPWSSAGAPPTSASPAGLQSPSPHSARGKTSVSRRVGVSILHAVESKREKKWEMSMFEMQSRKTMRKWKEMKRDEGRKIKRKKLELEMQGGTGNKWASGRGRERVRGKGGRRTTLQTLIRCHCSAARGQRQHRRQRGTMEEDGCTIRLRLAPHNWPLLSGNVPPS